MCVECEDTDATIYCKNCDDHYCALCYQWQHSKGTRFNHTKVALVGTPAALIGTTAQFTSPHSSNSSSSSVPPTKKVEGSFKVPLAPQGKLWLHEDKKEIKPELMIEEEEEEDEEDEEENSLAKKAMRKLKKRSLQEKIKWIPLRLTTEERGLLHLLEGALNVSEYTDKVDVMDNNYGFGFSFNRYSSSSRVSKPDRIKYELEEIFNTLSGLDVCKEFRLGTKMLGTSQLRTEFLKKCFEVGRRNKILNPDQMRSTYGKMIFMLQDSVANSRHIGMSLVEDQKISTVHKWLKEHKLLGMIEEDSKLVNVATKPIIPSPNKSAEQIKKETIGKEAALAELIKKYSSAGAPAEQVERVLQSISDNQYFLEGYRRPVDRMIHLLTTHFEPKSPESARLSLEIRSGRNGSKLSHDHSTQFTFVLQSLLLWQQVMEDMVRLWFLAESDLLGANNKYRLMETGQGLNRVQAAPSIGSAMSTILRDVHGAVREWVGLSVVHLGDRDVPNALVFIDKYTQVPRILGPIVHTLDQLQNVPAQDPGLAAVIHKHYGSVLMLKKEILSDYFRHGFDGSGSDGGSCIDGRLTSSWNWCSKIEKKQYFPFFLLTGFQGFDGDYRT
eukprot:TRINITY_DN2696_c0_g1_i1.p1 TRINITY_DN2696_c0_g1~~TRINITY_DN2696_c0_g1_i1.p1  ORF type:complete len:650 (+),score=159.89 TRINITY_DN2696_c0_g1_i1:115-1950(+)